MRLIPDVVAPILGYRVWQWGLTGLKSLNEESWYAGRALTASCRLATQGRSLGRVAESQGHKAPHQRCTCGVYAAKSLAHLSRSGYDRYGIVGDVYLWGSVVEHEMGWRAQYAYPRSLNLPLALMPVSASALESRLDTLSAYGCEIFVSDEKASIPLWCKQSGYDPDGLEMLLRRCNTWYMRHAQERCIQRGDRIAVLGRGIAAVNYADDLEIHASLWNREALRIVREHIVWNEENMRWETRYAGDWLPIAGTTST